MARLLTATVAALLALAPASTAALHVGRATLQTAGSHAVRIQNNASVAATPTADSTGGADGTQDNDGDNLPDDYVARAAAIESKCRALQKCVDLCAWVKRALVSRYGSAEKAFAAADADGDGAVSNEDFVAQCMAAGVTDAAMSTRGYIFLYIVDISLDGTVSLESYKRIFLLAESSGNEDMASVSNEGKAEIENSAGWGSVKRKADFAVGAPVEEDKKAEPLSHAANADRPNAAERLATTSFSPLSQDSPLTPRPRGKEMEKAGASIRLAHSGKSAAVRMAHGDRSAAGRRQQQHGIVTFLFIAVALVFRVAR